MAKKKKKSIPFHIAHNYKQFELRDRFENKSIIKFWARDEDAAKLYIKKVENR
jgi:hypothetical protein